MLQSTLENLEDLNPYFAHGITLIRKIHKILLSLRKTKSCIYKKCIILHILTKKILTSVSIKVQFFHLIFQYLFLSPLCISDSHLTLFFSFHQINSLKLTALSFNSHLCQVCFCVMAFGGGWYRRCGLLVFFFLVELKATMIVIMSVGQWYR